jgi:hypothetical protein
VEGKRASRAYVAGCHFNRLNAHVQVLRVRAGVGRGGQLWTLAQGCSPQCIEIRRHFLLMHATHSLDEDDGHLQLLHAPFSGARGQANGARMWRSANSPLPGAATLW